MVANQRNHLWGERCKAGTPSVPPVLVYFLLYNGTLYTEKRFTELTELGTGSLKAWGPLGCCTSWWMGSGRRVGWGPGHVLGP